MSSTVVSRTAHRRTWFAATAVQRRSCSGINLVPGCCLLQHPGVNAAVALLITLKLCRCIAIVDDRLLGRGSTGTARSASRFFWGSTSLQAIHCQLELTAMSPRLGPSAGAR